MLTDNETDADHKRFFTHERFKMFWSKHCRIQGGQQGRAPPRVQFLLFSCSFRGKIDQIIAFQALLRSWRLSGNFGSATTKCMKSEKTRGSTNRDSFTNLIPRTCMFTILTWTNFNPNSFFVFILQNKTYFCQPEYSNCQIFILLQFQANIVFVLVFGCNKHKTLIH